MWNGGFFGPSGGDGERMALEIFVVNSMNQEKANYVQRTKIEVTFTLLRLSNFH